jgi:hypothetical protein
MMTSRDQTTSKDGTTSKDWPIPRTAAPRSDLTTQGPRRNPTGVPSRESDRTRGAPCGGDGQNRRAPCGEDGHNRRALTSCTGGRRCQKALPQTCNEILNWVCNFKQQLQLKIYEVGKNDVRNILLDPVLIINSRHYHPSCSNKGTEATEQD